MKKSSHAGRSTFQNWLAEQTCGVRSMQTLPLRIISRKCWTWVARILSKNRSIGKVNALWAKESFVESECPMLVTCEEMKHSVAVRSSTAIFTDWRSIILIIPFSK